MKKAHYIIIVLLFSVTLLTAQTKLGLGVSGSYLNPTGDFGDVYKSGFGGTANLTYDLSDNFQLSAIAGYSQFSFNNEKYNELLSAFFSSFGTEVKVDIQSKLKIIPLMIGGKYFFSSSNFRPYSELNLGLHLVSVDASSIKVNGETLNAVAEQSKSTLGWGLGVGFLYKVAPKVNIDINGKICGNGLEVGTSMSSSSSGYSESQSSNSTVTFFSVSAGLMFEL
ncbi:MAG: hypothetical protein FD122_1509 [Stygiobacter sp.]|nr:MAG: hypothetical protein FD122_1509 [Stygiobacter sp.]KAF0210987.1 MAG: hypothetical protein FD178_3547 [Ignavibacteria bacterium]